MDFLITWDHELFRAINASLQGTLLEDFLSIVRNKYLWIPLYIGIFTYVFSANELNKASYIVLFMVSTVCLTDLVSSRLVKNTVQRPRPCQEVMLQKDIIQRVYCSRSFSFTSSHATNHFGIATLIAILFGRRRRWLVYTFFAWAALISFAQVFVGVHYPLDIIAGACLGIALVRIYSKLFTKWTGRSLEEIQEV